MIVAYAPTTDADEQIIEKSSDSLDELYSNCKSHEINILMGDFNAKIGCEKHGKTVGPHCLGMRFEQGERLIDWCEEKKLEIMNTWFAAYKKSD